LRAVAAIILVAMTGARAFAQAVDVSDLPPLPQTGDDNTSSAQVVAAASAEEDVVVGAAKREQSLGNVASAVTVVSADRIRRFGYRTVGDAVAGVAGAYLEDSRLVGSLGIRGMNIPGDYNTRILVLVDGATVNEAWGAFAGLGFDTFISIDDVARIEVIRGPVSSVYGANAFFGIINIVTRGASETPKAWGRVGVNSINGTVASAGFATGGLHQQLRGSVQAADRFGETLYLSDVGNALSSDGGHSLAVSLVGSYAGAFAQIRAYRYRRDSPFAPYNGDTTATDPFNEYDTQLLAEGGYTRELTDRLTLAVRGYGNIYEFSDHIVQIGTPDFEDFGDAATFGAEVRARYEILPKKLGLTAGAEANYNKTESHSFMVGDPGVTIPKDFDIEGAYAELDGQLGKYLGFVGGARFDRNSVIDNNVSPRAALFISNPESYGLKLLYAQGFRNPSSYEAFFFDGASFAQPDHLHAETIQSFESVLWAKPLPGLSTRLSAFYWDASNVVEAVPITDASGLQLQQFQNVAEFITRGVEAELSYRNTSGWYGFAGATYADVGTGDGTTAVVFGSVPDAPKLTASVGISTPKLFARAHLSTELLVIGERPTRANINTGEAETPSPAWLDWNAAVYVPNINGFDVTAGIRNIIGKRNLVPSPGDYDRTVDDPGTTISRIPGEGREVYVKVGYSY